MEDQIGHMHKEAEKNAKSLVQDVKIIHLTLFNMLSFEDYIENDESISKGIADS